MKTQILTGITLILLAAGCGFTQKPMSHVSSEGDATVAATPDQTTPYFEGTVSAPWGNHGTYYLEFVSPTVLKYTSTYGGDTWESTFDLVNDIDNLLDLIDMVSTAEDFVESYPEKVGPVLDYLRKKYAEALVSAPETLYFSFGQADYAVRPGSSHYYRVRYAAREAGIVLFELQDAKGTVLASEKASIEAGTDIAAVSLVAPSDMPVFQTGYIVAKLLSTDGLTVRAEVKEAVELNGPQMFERVDAYQDKFSTGASFSTTIRCTQPCEVLAEIFDAQGQVMGTTKALAGGAKAHTGVDGYFVNLSIDDAGLDKEQTYSYKLTLYPAGGDVKQAFDDLKGVLRKND